MIQLYDLGELRAMIDGRFSMDQAADAHRLIEEGVDREKVMLLNHS